MAVLDARWWPTLTTSVQPDVAPEGRGRKPDWSGRAVVTHALLWEQGRALAAGDNLVRERLLDTAASAWHRRRLYLEGRPIWEVVDLRLSNPSRRDAARHRIYQAKVWSQDMGARICATGAAAALDPARLTPDERRRGGHEMVFGVSETWLRMMDALWLQVTTAIEDGRCTPTRLPH